MKTQELYRSGMSAYRAGQYEQAIEHLTPLAKGGPTEKKLLSRFYLAQAHYRLAVELFNHRDFAEAIAHFEAAASVNPLGNNFAAYLAACYLGSRQYELATRELESLLDHHPENVRARIQLALGQHRQGQPLQAMATLREGLCLQPDQAELHYQLGVMLAAEGDYPEAERCFDMAILHQPDHARAHERLAQVFSTQQRHDRALAYLEKAHALEPLNPRIALQLSLLGQREITAGRRTHVAWQRNPQPPRADRQTLDQLGQLIAAEPDFVEAFLALPKSDIDPEVFSTLAATIETALSRHPEYADLHYHCGAIYRRLGRRQAAIEHTERAIQINPEYVIALIQLADLYGQTDQWGMGVERLQQAIHHGADYPDVHHLLGRLYLDGNRPGQARSAFQRALELNNTYAAARQSLEALSA